MENSLSGTIWKSAVKPGKIYFVSILKIKLEMTVGISSMMFHVEWKHNELDKAAGWGPLGRGNCGRNNVVWACVSPLSRQVCCSLLGLVVSGCKLWTEGWQSEGGVTPAWAAGIWGGSSAICEGLHLSPVTKRVVVTKLSWWLEHMRSVLGEPALVSGRHFSHFWGEFSCMLPTCVR